MELVYQPQVSLADGRIGSVEALLRWSDAEEGAISPSEFVPLAEHTRMIDELSFMVLEMAATQNCAWRKMGLDIRISVNLSARQMIDLKLPEKIQQSLLCCDARPDHFTLEVTETDVMVHPELAQSVMQKLNAMGFELSIDDFGTGYSSFSYLRKLPVDELKIDQTFIRDFAKGESDRKIVAGMVSLAHGLNLQVVAEGVEDSNTLKGLQELGVDRVQGFLISQPLPPDQFVAWLNENGGVYRP